MSKRIPACSICEGHVKPFLLFGKMPIANRFITKEEFCDEPFFDLEVGCCETCSMVQLTQRIDPSKLFHQNYAYFSSTSIQMAKHFERFAIDVKAKYLIEKNSFVVEIGSNDGILLSNFSRWDVRHLGIEPSKNVAEVALSKGVRTLCGFFNEGRAKQVREAHGKADLILGANVICHIPDLHSLVRGISELMTDKGVFIFEEPYLGDILEKTAFDQIYDEHVFYFSVYSLSQLFSRYDFEIIDVVPQNVHGGSMRYSVARRGVYPPSAAVGQQRQIETRLGLTHSEVYVSFARRVFQFRDELRSLLTDLKNQGRRVVGYGATSKSTTVTNFCQIGPDWVEYITDTTPGKQGKYSPGMHIPIFSYDRFNQSYPDYALLFAWNHDVEIIAKEKEFTGRGGKFIRYVPKVHISGDEK